MMKITRNSVPHRWCAVGYLTDMLQVERILVLERVDRHVLGAVILEHAPYLARATDHEQVADENDDPNKPLDQMLQQELTWAHGRAGRSSAQEERQQHEESDGQRQREEKSDGHGAAAEFLALPLSLDGAGAHQPARTNYERLVQDDQATEERGAREPAAVEDRVEWL